jgi:hypothetical protein
MQEAPASCVCSRRHGGFLGRLLDVTVIAIAIAVTIIARAIEAQRATTTQGVVFHDAHYVLARRVEAGIPHPTHRVGQHRCKRISLKVQDLHPSYFTSMEIVTTLWIIHNLTSQARLLSGI